MRSPEVYFLVGTNSAHDIGAHADVEAARKSDQYHTMGGEKCGQMLVNRPCAHEIMRQLKRALIHYDNSDCKEGGRYFNIKADIPSQNKVVETCGERSKYPNKKHAEEYFAKSQGCEAKQVILRSITELTKEDFDEYWRE